MHIELRAEPFDPWQLLAGYEASRPGIHGQYGATAVFLGTLRDFSQGRNVKGLTLEHYPEMTEKYLSDLAATAQKRHAILDALIVHRVGEVREHETIVVVAAWAAHRGAAFDACRETMEALKSQAPFWKREQTELGPRWVSPD